MRQPPAKKTISTNGGYKRQDDVPATVDGAWRIAPLCQILVCGVHVLDGYEALHDVFKKRKKETQTQGHGRLVNHTCIVEPHDGAGFDTLVQTRPLLVCEQAVHVITSQLANQIKLSASERRSTRLNHSVFNTEPRRCQTVTSYFMRKPTCLTTVLHLAVGFLRLMDRKSQCSKKKKQKTMNSRGAVGTSTRVVACASASKPQLLCFFRKQRPAAPLKCTIENCIVLHPHRVAEIDHTVGAVAAVQKLWRDLTMTEIAKKNEPTFLRDVLRDDHEASLGCGCRRRRRSGA